MNFLIVVPRFAKKGEFYSFPFGLAYISSYLKSKGFAVFCLNLCQFTEEEQIEKILETWINKNKIDAVMTGGMSCHWEAINNVIESVKNVKKNIITITGGPVITSDPFLAMENMQIDYGVIGEGEITAAELAETLITKKGVENIKGIIYRKDTRLICNKERPPIMDLDSLPIPDYDNFDYDECIGLMKYSGQEPILENYDIVRHFSIIGSRSCPFSCTFCYHPLGKTYRQRSLQNIFKEIDYLVDRYKINFIFFSDELFSTNIERMLEFAERMKKYNIKWDAMFRVNTVTKEILDKLKTSGLYFMVYGVESMSDRILKSMNKKITKKEIENAFKMTYEAGIACSGNILLGDPAETTETIDESISWWRSNRHYNISLTYIKAIPDSVVYQNAVKNKIIKDKLKHIKNNFPIINLTKIPDKKFNEIKKEIIKNQEKINFLKLGKLLNTEKLKEKYNGHHFYNFTVECPLCNKVHEYKRFLKSMNKHLGIFCKSCNSCFTVDQKKIFYDDFSFWKMFSKIYTTKAYSYLLKNNIIKKDNKFIILAKNNIKKLLKIK